MNTARIYRPLDVERIFDISRPTRWRWERIGRLPKRDVHLPGGRPQGDGWHVSTIDKILAPASQPA